MEWKGNYGGEDNTRMIHDDAEEYEGFLYIVVGAYMLDGEREGWTVGVDRVRGRGFRIRGELRDAGSAVVGG